MNVLFSVIFIVCTFIPLGLLYNLFARRRLNRLIIETWTHGRPPICYACNYDLRGSPGPTCPECGEKIPTLADLGMAEQNEALKSTLEK